MAGFKDTLSKYWRDLVASLVASCSDSFVYSDVLMLIIRSLTWLEILVASWCAVANLLFFVCKGTHLFYMLSLKRNKKGSCEMLCINIRYEKSIAKMVNCMF